MMESELAQSAMLIGFFLVIGATVGVIAGAIGLGGGVVLAPGLYFAMTALDYPDEIAAHLAVGTAAATIFLVSVVGLRIRLRLKVIDVAQLKSSAPFLALGAALGAVVAVAVTGPVLTTFMGLAAFIMGLAVIFLEGPARRGSEVVTLQGPQRWGAAIAAGIVSGVAGLGGGAAAAPLYRASGLDPARANATASGAGAMIAAPTAVVFLIAGLNALEETPPFALGYINVAAVAVATPMILASAPLGAQIALMAPARIPRLLFAFILAMVGLSIVRRAGVL